MSWHVIWRAEAETQLRALLRQANDREEISIAVEMMERQLEMDPLSLGESREGSSRVFFYEAFGIAFEVDENDHFVYVRLFWRYAK